MKKSKAPVLRPPGCGLTLDRANASYYGKRSQKNRPKLTHFVEGGWYTYKELASRVGVGGSTIEKRVRALQEASEELTWESLKRPATRAL